VLDAANTGSPDPPGEPPTDQFAQAWSPFITDGGMYSSPAVVDGTVYVGSWGNHVYALAES
jgi:outer membrane protein assembly factor BamB